MDDLEEFLDKIELTYPSDIKLGLKMRTTY